MRVSTNDIDQKTVLKVSLLFIISNIRNSLVYIVCLCTGIIINTLLCIYAICSQLNFSTKDIFLVHINNLTVFALLYSTSSLISITFNFPFTCISSPSCIILVLNLQRERLYLLMNFIPTLNH